MQQHPQEPNADTLLNLGINQIHQYQFAVAVQTLQKALALFNRVPDYPGIVSALTNLGVAYRNLKQPEQAILCYKQALDLGRQMGAQPFFMASALNNLGISYIDNQHFQSALACFQSALPIYQQMRDRRGEANVLGNLSATHHHLKHPQQAGDCYQRAIQIARSLQDFGLETSLVQLVTLHARQVAQSASAEANSGTGMTREASPQQSSGSEKAAGADVPGGPEKRSADLWVKSLETQLRQQGADDLGVLDKFNQLGETCCSEGKNAEAEAIWLRALELLQQIHGENNLASGLLLRRLAKFYRSQQQYSDAESVIQRSLHIFQQLFDNSHPLIGVSFNDLAGLYFRQGRYREAEALYLQAIPILKAIGDQHPDTQNALQNFQHLLQQAQTENRLAELSDHQLTQATLRAISLL
ncbi:tetratricopeptide repeat protein [Nodosilinea sp. LEGE 07088]|uniref:tetratricopeptide repeat protein n=1 Tax=Nodosilinea sp. LEGE 07088 TaxID=2777968 RepID=UPI001880D56D|nr:tetratricopeptide repeat protein [Nodosilinea sp. LEGE 07088]MBE9137730.1 tetratricopeptide repeat protein [Nodosilinea sp. LEGE 07088]